MDSTLVHFSLMALDSLFPVHENSISIEPRGPEIHLLWVLAKLSSFSNLVLTLVRERIPACFVLCYMASVRNGF